MNIRNNIWFLLLLNLFFLPTCPIIRSALNLTTSFAFMTLAYYMGQDAQEKYDAAVNTGKECGNIDFFSDCANGKEKELLEKCQCRVEKYKEVIPRAFATVILAGFGLRFGFKGIFKGIF